MTSAPFRLSVLDQSPVSEGFTAADAVKNTIDLARTVDVLGYDRFWMAEHHASAGLAGSAPEALIGPVALATQRIRVGSGGIMLPHYSPFKVAETFRLLGAIAPGRIDLGIGRAPGTDQRTAYALQRDRSRRIPSDDFPNHLAELLAYLSDSLPADHVFATLGRSLPDGTAGSPDPWLLGSSPDSARWAGEMGLPYCIADFINPEGVPLAHLYRQHFQPSRWADKPHLMVSSFAIAADTREEAERQSLPAAMMFAHMMRGELIKIPSLERAVEWAIHNPNPLQAGNRRRIMGSPTEVRPMIEEVAALYGAQEVMLVNIMSDHAARKHSYRLIAEAFDMVPAQAA
ncbi:LLM class flavin-dependent oxidoreductase [Sphingomonas montanisoli]|uniref:Luciferase-like monooxygenase n=1 Tax=Sphingomonas montanisoli TaxID=2606412 RepID=A0A5D9C889_9SPHN|nr:LLM class flavin-dependent oxidoreductase [Sphingomonas montanisoli]TZG27342.1 LLM class flavin-dependent oxidoreductase [Sphingomonas montanisoli]